MKGLLEDIEVLKISIIMIDIIHKILVLLQITRILKRFLRSITDLFFLKQIIFSQYIMMESSRLEEENIIKEKTRKRNKR